MLQCNIIEYLLQIIPVQLHLPLRCLFCIGHGGSFILISDSCSCFHAYLETPCNKAVKMITYPVIKRIGCQSVTELMFGAERREKER